MVGRQKIKYVWYFTNPPRLLFQTVDPPTWKWLVLALPVLSLSLPVLSDHETNLIAFCHFSSAHFQSISSMMWGKNMTKH